jgi:outer membrane lipoprotein-sorting protein
MEGTCARMAFLRLITVCLVVLVVTFGAAHRPASAVANRSASPDAPRLEQMVATDLVDLQAKVSVVKADQAELAKITRDMGLFYRLNNLTLSYKEPNKLRMEGRIGHLVFNGANRYFRVPALQISKKDDLGDSPGKRYSTLELGLLSRSFLAATQSRFLREETVDGTRAYVFDVSYRGDDTSRNVVWVDATTHALIKRDWLDGAGKRKATFLYLEPREVKPGIWFPTRIELRTADDVVAAVTAYSDVKVNQGLAETLFEIS